MVIDIDNVCAFCKHLRKDHHILYPGYCRFVDCVKRCARFVSVRDAQTKGHKKTEEVKIQKKDGD